MINFDNFQTGVSLVFDAIQGIGDKDGFMINDKFFYIYKDGEIKHSFYNIQDGQNVSKLMIFSLVKFLFGNEGFLAIKGAAMFNEKISKAIEDINFFKIVSDNKIDNIKVSNKIVLVKYQDSSIQEFTFDELMVMIEKNTKGIDFSQLQ